MKKQTELPGNVQRDIRWSSHIPLNTSIIKSFPVTGVLELGAGMHSTPMFFNNIGHVISIESDSNWIAKLREGRVIEDDTHKLVHHDTPTILRGTPRSEVSKQDKIDAISFYKSNLNSHLNFLFVDCYMAFRLVALTELYKMFDVITYHDAEPACDYQYGYSELVVDSSYSHYTDQTFLVHNGFIVSNRLAPFMDKFNQTFAEQSKTYAESFGALHQVTLKRIS